MFADILDRRAQMHRATESFAHAQQQNLRELGSLARTLENTKDELAVSQVQAGSYHSLLQGTGQGGGGPPY